MEQNYLRNKRNLSQLILHLYRIKSSKLRSALLGLCFRTEGGEYFSKTARIIFEKYHDIRIGMYSYGCFFPHNIPPGTSIGRYTSFAREVLILNGNHPSGRKSTHPFFFNPVFGYVDELKINRTRISIGNDVWIGARAIILPSVTHIGDGAIIGAGSVVTKNVPPFAIVAGNPARLIRYRFSFDLIKEIIDSSWWNLDIDDLRKQEGEFLKFQVDLNQPPIESVNAIQNVG